ncbi:MAG: hypothetical protein KUG56_06725 [Kordiimonadaceae bacterium]|nr:hypothetical protein [Kordiimonadaceae bacterium]
MKTLALLISLLLAPVSMGQESDTPKPSVPVFDSTKPFTIVEEGKPRLKYAQPLITDKLMMVCADVRGKRVDYMHTSKKFDEGDDGYSNAKHIFIFDPALPKQVSARWQSTLPDGLGVIREDIQKIAQDKFQTEAVVMIDGLRITTVLLSGPSIYTAMYDFENSLVLATRLTAGLLSNDVAAYYKGRCERLN